MNKWRMLIPAILVITVAVYVHAQQEMDDEGIADDPNHPRTVEVMRENGRIDKELSMVSGMLLEIFDDKEYAEGYGEFAAKVEKRNLKAANEAWEKYAAAEMDLETQLNGTGAKGFPGQERQYKCDTELARERISRLRKIMSSIYEHEYFLDSKGKLTLKIKGMQEKLNAIEKTGTLKKAIPTE